MESTHSQITGQVRPYDHPLRWWVKSGTNTNHAYIVDLGAFGGNGECGCKNFIIERRPLLRVEPMPLPSSRTRCKHINAALAEFNRRQIAGLRYVELMAQAEPKKWGPAWALMRRIFENKQEVPNYEDSGE